MGDWRVGRMARAPDLIWRRAAAGRVQRRPRCRSATVPQHSLALATTGIRIFELPNDPERFSIRVQNDYMPNAKARALFTLLWISSSSAVAQNALTLFHKMQDALGSVKKIAGVRDLEQDARAQTWDGNTGRFLGEVRKRTRWIRPNLLRVDQIGPGSTYVLYFDGTAGWEILPGTQSAVELTGGELEFARKYVRDFALTIWLADRNPVYTITSPGPNVVRISDGNVAHQVDVTLDPVSSLPVKTASLSLADPAHPTASETITTEWEVVNGIRFPRRWIFLRSGVRVAEATVHTKVDNGLKAADLAAKPEDSRPVASSR